MMSTLVILNPNAGSAGDVDALQAALARLGDVEVRETNKPGEACTLAQTALAEGAELIVAAGGDGTVNEVVNGLAGGLGRARLGIIPMGTGNDFVRTINIPTDIEQAVDVLAKQHTRKLDIVRVQSDESRYFINVANGGFSGLVNEKLTDEMKSSWGPLSYLRGALAALPNLQDYHTFVTFDDEDEQEIAAYNITVANARYVAKGIPLAPRAEPADGLLDVVIVQAAALPQLATLVPQILLGNHLDSDLIIFRRVRKVAVRAQPGMWFNVDGELVGNEPSSFEVVPLALEVVVGPETT
jgi:diacylglycerol kinase (ATP)